MKKKGLLLIVLLLAISLLFGGCTEQPALEPEAKSDLREEPVTEVREPHPLEIYSNPFGTAGYVLSFALAEIINAESEWLTATAIETPSGSHNMKILQREPQRAENWIGYLNTLNIHHSSVGGEPFTPEEPFEMDVRAVSIASNICELFVTNNPNIMEPEDLRGKRIAVGPKGNTAEFIPRFLMEHWGVIDDVDIATMTHEEVADALIDSRIDVGRNSVQLIEAGVDYAEWVPIPSMERLAHSIETYIFPVSKEDYAKAREATGYPLYPIGAKGGTIGKSTFPDTLGAHISLGWFVSAEMPEDVVEELIRIIYENADKFMDYHISGSTISKDSIGGIAIAREKYHPVVIDFLEEKGHEVGR